MLDARVRSYAPYIVLVLMVSAYFVGFSATVLNEYNRFWYANFDLGIPDQGIWLLSQFKDPYLTTRGLHLFGDHASYIHLLVAPLYWVWDDVKALLLLHTAVLAAGAIPVYLIGRERLRNRWQPLVLSFSYLMLPALHFSNLDQGYHYESFVVPFMLFGYYALLKGKTNVFHAMTFLSVICKEEIAVTFILYGLYIAVKHDKKIGLTTTAFSIAYLLVVMSVLLPAFNEEGAFYEDRTLGSYGKTPGKKLRSFTNASIMWSKLDTEKNRIYVRKLLGPVGYLVLLEPHAMAASGSLWLNLLQDWSYAHEIQYHYVTPIIPLIFIALAEGLARFKRNQWLMGFLLLTLFASALHGNYHHSPPQSTLKEPERMMDEVMRFDHVGEEEKAIIAILDSLADDASVSATYNLVTHLSHREKIYMFPNPFRVNLYGINEQGVHPDKEVDYVVLDIRLVEDEEKKHGSVSKVTETGKYELVTQYRYLQVWKNKRLNSVGAD